MSQPTAMEMKMSHGISERIECTSLNVFDKLAKKIKCCLSVYGKYKNVSLTKVSHKDYIL